tara:strand:+ start:54 stop:503 length:450 start_codon:yes stop_codon:yes gene_type:complete
MNEIDSQVNLETMTVTMQSVMKQAQQKIIELAGENIHGKDYKTVAVRVKVFREHFPNFALRTSILEKTDDHVAMIAQVFTPFDRLLATGHAVEDKHTNFVNETSMIENCETSAIGRALANFGLAGDEMASAHEIARAKAKAKAKENKNG